MFAPKPLCEHARIELLTWFEFFQSLTVEVWNSKLFETYCTSTSSR